MRIIHKLRNRKHLRARMWRDNGTNKKSEGRKQEYCSEMSVSSNCCTFLSSRYALDKTGSSKLSSTLMRTVVVYGRSVLLQVRVFATVICVTYLITACKWRNKLRFFPQWMSEDVFLVGIWSGSVHVSADVYLAGKMIDRPYCSTNTPKLGEIIVRVFTCVVLKTWAGIAQSV